MILLSVDNVSEKDPIFPCADQNGVFGMFYLFPKCVFFVVFL